MENVINKWISSKVMISFKFSYIRQLSILVNEWKVIPASWGSEETNIIFEAFKDISNDVEDCTDDIRIILGNIIY